MPKYLPGNPTAIVQNMPGGGNVVATNYMYNNALKDGTVIAVINDAIPLHQVIDGRGVRFDADKFNWLGSPGDRNSVTFAWHTSGIKTIEDVMQREVVLGGTGVALEHRRLPDRDEQGARHEVQDRARLSQLVGGVPRDGARRDRGAQRGSHIGARGISRLDSREEDQLPGPARARSAIRCCPTCRC